MVMGALARVMGEAMVMEGAAMVEATVAKSIAWAEDVKEEREEHLAVAST